MVTQRAGHLAACAIVVLGALAQVGAAGAQVPFQRISGEGSSWAANAIDAARVNVSQDGITVDYNPSGSSAGRKNFLNGTVDFAVSDIPFQFAPEDGSAPESPAAGSYAYVPATAGGLAFMYNLRIDGQRVTNLRLSGENVAKIFTRVITNWNDPALAADNPGLRLPERPIVPVVRSDGAGPTAQFTQWMISEHTGIWSNYCQASGRAPACGQTSFYPIGQGMIAQSGDIGVAGYVSQDFAEGAIGYVNYAYGLGVQFPVAKVLNKAGYYTEPTPQNVAVSLLQAQINTDANDPATYLTPRLDGVYDGIDPRNYELSSYSLFIVPTTLTNVASESKGRTIAAFVGYFLCTGQQQSASLGYAPLPVNLVQAGFDRLGRIPGADVSGLDIANCDNPTFSPDGSNRFAETAPMPAPCDALGVLQCATGTGGVKDVPTVVVALPTTTAPATTSPSTTIPSSTSAPTTAPTASPSTAPTASPTTAQAVSTVPAGFATGPRLPSTGGSTAPVLVLATLLVVFGRVAILVRRRPRVLDVGGSTTGSP